MSDTQLGPSTAESPILRQRQWVHTWGTALRLKRTKIGVAIIAAIAIIAIFGPLAAPHSATQFVGVPNAGSSSHALFGTDSLGRDVLSRFLHGGLSILWLSLASTALGVVVGVLVGLTAAYARGWLDEVLMRLADVFLAFPQLVFALLLISALGPNIWLIVLTVGITHAPRVARVIRGAAVQVVERDFVTAADAAGEKRTRILFAELLPNVISPLTVEIGLRLTYSVGLIAGISFLGLGLQPPHADWGLMINENRLSIAVQPWAVALPVLAIALLTVGTNLVTDGIARTSIRLRPPKAAQRPGRRPNGTSADHLSRSQTDPVVSVEDLGIGLADSGTPIVEGISFTVNAGEVLGLIGESGSGKTTVGMALLGYVRPGSEISRGTIVVDGNNLVDIDDFVLRGLRGAVVAYVPQDPGTALNPALRIGTQLRETLEAHTTLGAAEVQSRVRETLDAVALPTSREFQRRYPHQLSGGQQQRVAIATAFACKPRVIVCDEPTTGLDVTTQAQVLTTVRELCQRYGVAVLYITHDLAVVADLADRIAVMYAGGIVEAGNRVDLLATPRHPYTQRLLQAVPDLAGKRSVVGIPGRAPQPRDRPSGCRFEPRCRLAIPSCRELLPPMTELPREHQVRCYRAAETSDGTAADRAPAPTTVEAGKPILVADHLNATHGSRPVLFDINLEVRDHECVALVGESGSGKTTLARALVGLHAYAGELRLHDAVLSHSARQRSQDARRQIQLVFQNPYASLNPHRTVGQTIARQLQLVFPDARGDISRRVVECLEQVALPDTVINRFPEELSGGERQRVAIARALAARPAVLICDEVTSALDVSVQAAMVNLLRDLRDETGIGILFITHNLALVRAIADRVCVIAAGRIVEAGPVSSVFEAPSAPYTQQLLADTPSIAIEQHGALLPDR